MKNKVKFYKKFVSFFLVVMMLNTIVFSGIKASAATDANNGDWTAENVTLTNTSEAQLMTRVGDIDNFGFGWTKTTTTGYGWNKTTVTTTINPFSGVETDAHSFPFSPGSSDPQGTDRIMAVTGYNSKYTSVGTNTDGYTVSTTSYSKAVKPVVLNYSTALSGISVQNATLQMFLDDFQPGNARGVTQGTVQYTATINGVEIPELSNVINNLDQSGPIGKLVTFQIPQRYLDLIRTGNISLKFDDTTSCTGDGYAIDFVKLLINKTDSTTNTATITGNIKDSNNNNIQGATVSAGGVVTATTDTSGNYELDNVPAGQAIVTASKSGYNSSSVTIPTVIAGGGYTANFTLTSSTPPTTPIISATPTTPTNSKVTATIGYSSDSTIQQYRIDIGGVTGEWKDYTQTGSFPVTQNCVIEAQGINQYGNASQIASYTVSNIDTTAPTITLSQSPTTSTNGNVTVTAAISDASGIAVQKWASGSQIASYFGSGGTTLTGSTFSVASNGTYTVYAKDNAGNETVQTITISNIDTTPPTLSLCQTPTTATNSNVTINVTASDNVAIATTKWLAGTKTVSDFASAGTVVSNGAFTVSANGTYTVYTVDTAGNAVVKTITISNIDTAAPSAPVITGPTTGTVTNNSTPTITGTAEANSTVKVYDGTTLIGTVTADGSGNWTLTPITALSDGAHAITATATDASGNVSSVSNTVNITIDVTPPVLTLSQSTTALTKGTVTISATATDNVAVASIKKPDNSVVTGSSTTYTVSANGIYVFIATDTAGNMTTQIININNIVISSTNDTSFPNISASLESVTPNPAKSSDEVNVKYAINTVPFSLSSGMIDEAEVLVDMSQAMKNNQRFSELQNGFVNQVINDSNLSGIKLGVVGYNDSVYIGTRSNYSDPKSSVMQQTDENLSNISKTNFLPLYNLNDGNTKDGYRQFYQNGYIYNDISSNDQRQFGSALKAADNVLTNYGTNGAKKAIIIVSSGNLTYSDAQIESIIGKGYKIIVLDISNSNSTNIKDTYMKLCGNQSGINGNYYKGTLNDGVNYNSVDADMKNVDTSLKGLTGVTTLSINDAKLNIDLGENFEAVDGGGLEGSGKVCTATIPQINYTYNSTTGLWEQSGSVEVDFKVKSESGKYGQLGFGLYTNSDNTTNTNSSIISYTNFYNIATNKIIETPTINIIKNPSAPVITGPTDGTITKNNKPTITGTADANSTVNVYDGTTLIGTVVADASGNWSIIPTTALADGPHSITATATDSLGNVSAVSNTVNITIDTTSLAPVITGPTDGTVTKNNTPTITGTAEANSTVNVYDGTTLIGTVTADASGNWTLIPTTALIDGTHAITATATDGLGNVSPSSNKVNITIDTTGPALTLTQNPTDGTNGQVTITVTATDIGSGVTSIINNNNTDGKTNGTVTIGGVGTYTVSVNGTYSFTATDNLGNTTTKSIDINNIYATVQGTVTDSVTKNPISGAVVKVKNTNGDTLSSAITGSDGKYTLNNIVAPEAGVQINIVASAGDDYNTQSYTQTLIGRVDPYSQDFSLSKYNLPSIDLSQSPDASTYTNSAVTITATGTAGTNSVKNIILPDSTSVSGSSAQYQVTSNGSYTFTVEDTAGKTSQATITINNIYATVQGTVTSDSTTNSPISGATVTVKNANGDTLSSMTTGSDGKYAFNNIVAPASGAEVTIEASASDYSTQSSTQTLVGRVNAYEQNLSLSSNFEPSSIKQHGIYSGSGTDIASGNNVTNGIPVTMAMIVDAESSQPVINLSVDNNQNITIDNTSFKEYEIAQDGTIGSATSLSIDNSGNIAGFTMQKGKEYVIVYTITPVGNGNVTLTATADVTSAKAVTLTIGAKPDLF